MPEYGDYHGLGCGTLLLIILGAILLLSLIPVK
jgi:hypothetical protein